MSSNQSLLDCFGPLSTRLLVMKTYFKEIKQIEKNQILLQIINNVKSINPEDAQDYTNNIIFSIEKMMFDIQVIVDRLNVDYFVEDYSSDPNAPIFLSGDWNKKEIEVRNYIKAICKLPLSSAS